MASPPNPTAIPAVTYEYLFYLPSSDRLRPPTRRKARGLLTMSCTLGYHGSPNTSSFLVPFGKDEDTGYLVMWAILEDDIPSCNLS
jgi:hypothetical protein